MSVVLICRANKEEGRIPMHRNVTKWLTVIAACTIVWVWAAVSAQAFSTLNTFIDIDQNGTNDLVAQSRFTKAAFSQRADIYDTITVFEAAPANLTKMPFDWHIDQGHQFKGTLPWAGKWTATNHWYTYRYPFHADFSLDIDPQGTGIAAFTKTAEAHQPHLVIDKILGLLTAQVGGDIGSGEDPYTPQVSVWAVVTQTGSTFDYEYWAQNSSSGSAYLNWTAYSLPDNMTQWPDETFTNIYVAPGQTVKLGGFSTNDGREPYETNGKAVVRFGDDSWTFFAPTLVPIPEPSSASVLLFGAISLAGLIRRRSS
ncbi:MAG: hypothetical protein HYX78_05515 [Armatimonadetes bacterium]|nr:hypothetical protein [Armatimonadota bacterium]